MTPGWIREPANPGRLRLLKARRSHRGNAISDSRNSGTARTRPLDVDAATMLLELAACWSDVNAASMPYAWPGVSAETTGSVKNI
jgi:hypothetical protein